MNAISDIWEWNLSPGQKRVTAWAFGVLAGIAMFLFSYPNTFNFFKSVILISTQYKFLNTFVALAISIFFNGLELAALYLLIWKINKSVWGAILAFLLILICAFFSVVGTFGSLETADKTAAAEQENVSLLKLETQNIHSSIEKKTALLDANNQQINALQAQGNDASTFLYNRSLKLLSEIDSLNLCLSQRAEVTRQANLSAPKMAFKKDEKSWFNLLFAPIIELLMLICSALSILVYRDIPSEDDNHNEGYVYISTGNRPALIAAAQNKHIGFNPSDSDTPVTVSPKKGVTGDTAKVVSRDTDLQVSPKRDVTGDSDTGVTGKAQKILTVEEIPGEIKTKLRRFFSEKGKSDDTILFLHDHVLGRNIKRISLMTGEILNREPINREYVRRVIKRERGA